MKFTTFNQDFFNSISIKKPFYLHAFKFLLAVIASYCYSKIFNIVPAILLSILICFVIYTFMDYIYYMIKVSYKDSSLYKNVDKVKSIFVDNEYSKDKDGNLYNVYKLYLRCRKDDFSFYIYQYGTSEDEIYNYWLEHKDFVKEYSLYKVELFLNRRTT